MYFFREITIELNSSVRTESSSPLTLLLTATLRFPLAISDVAVVRVNGIVHK
jgi:hypothetical protein